MFQIRKSAPREEPVLRSETSEEILRVALDQMRAEARHRDLMKQYDARLDWLRRYEETQP
jgi:hypothetical protein